jgi:5S rRNA maturation endonuclease (ribonuclease M5)
MSYVSIEEAMIYGHGIERQFRCHVHGDTNPSASVNSLTGLWFCYACGAKGKYNVSQIPPDKAATALIRYVDTFLQEIKVYPESWLDVFDSMGPGEYWLSRFNPLTCRRYRLGVDPARKFATIPVRDVQGQVLGVTRRDLTGVDDAKYRYPSGVTMSKLLFNQHHCTGDTLMLTEGATDAIAAHEAGWGNVMATYRNGISLYQQMLIREYAPKQVLIAYDQDEAGERGARQITHVLRDRYKVDRLTWTEHKDLASIPLVERAKMMDFLHKIYP